MRMYVSFGNMGIASGWVFFYQVLKLKFAGTEINFSGTEIKFAGTEIK